MYMLCVTNDTLADSLRRLVQTEHIPVTFSTTIILFVTVSLSDSKSPFAINFSIFVHPARSVSDSPDIFDSAVQKCKMLFAHSCSTTKLSVPEQVSVGKRSVRGRGGGYWVGPTVHPVKDKKCLCCLCGCRNYWSLLFNSLLFSSAQVIMFKARRIFS